MKVDILFLAKNRSEYTEEALLQLEKNTNWGLVDQLTLVDDSSTDGTTEMLRSATDRMPVTTNFRRTQHCSPVAIMNWYLSGRRPAGIAPNSPWFAKIDNDTIVPPGWLDACVAIAETDNVDLIGIEARYCENAPMRPEPTYGNIYPIVQYRRTDHIGGIGLFRRSVFESRPLPKPNNTYYGFTEWQWEHTEVRKCWIDPPLPVFLLDHVPMEPWKSLGEEYVRKGWQRESWGMYDPVKDRGLWEWWLWL